jgi:surface antigen
MKKLHTRTTLLAATAALLLPMAPGAYAEPPPWAPAHGWRKKHDPYYKGYSGRDWKEQYGIIDGRCKRAEVGSVLGGAAGGAVAIILGTVLGSSVGHQIDSKMDDADRGCLGHSLELAADQRTVYWTGANNWNYRVTPLRNFEQNGQKCREYRLRVNGRDIDKDTRERACLVRPGEWKPIQ